MQIKDKPSCAYEQSRIQSSALLAVGQSEETCMGENSHRVHAERVMNDAHKTLDQSLWFIVQRPFSE